MPKETAHWGKRYISKHIPETEEHGEWWDELPYHGIESDFKGNREELPENQVATRSPSVEVHWSRPEEHAAVAYDEIPTGKVQIGLTLDRGEWAMYHSYYLNEEKAERNGVSSTTIFTKALSRAEINNLIKVLRRARDAAEGADQ